MINCIGSLPPRAAVLAVPGAHYHAYGKAARPGRKVGHITLRADTPAALEAGLSSCCRWRATGPMISTVRRLRGTLMTELQREHAEQHFAEELHVLAEQDRRTRPPNWRLSPWAVTTYLLGGTLDNGFSVTPKYIGSRRLIEIAAATLATDALLLLGVPGTAKTWVSEHLAAAICGSSTAAQGTAGTSEEAIRYGWNYARLLAEGPSPAALVPSPVMRAMQEGSIARVEELTRIPADVQDALITVLSEKTLPIPELDSEAGPQGL